MPVFRCFIRGENFPGTMAGQPDPIGFYATRFVEAESPEFAETTALDLLRGDPAFNVPPELRTEDARVYFESIEEVSVESGWSAGGGFTFYPMGT